MKRSSGEADAAIAARADKGNEGSQAAANGGVRTFGSFREIADFLWQNAERLRGAYKPNEYDKVILPLLVIRRLDCVLDQPR